MTWWRPWTPSGWQAVKLVTYQEGVDAFRSTERLSDSDKVALMGASLTRVYRWAPSPA